MHLQKDVNVEPTTDGNIAVIMKMDNLPDAIINVIEQ